MDISTKILRVRARLVGFLTAATALLLAVAGVVEVFAAPRAWCEPLSWVLLHAPAPIDPPPSQALAGIAGLAVGFFLPLVLSFLIPWLYGSGTIGPRSMRVEIPGMTSQEAAERIAVRMQALGLEATATDIGTHWVVVGTHGLNPLVPSPGRNRAREVTVRIGYENKALVGEGEFRYLATDAVGVDTGEGEYAEESLRFVLVDGPSPSDEIRFGQSWIGSIGALTLLSGVIFARAGILAPAFGLGLCITGSVTTLSGLGLAVLAAGPVAVLRRHETLCAAAMLLLSVVMVLRAMGAIG